MLPLSAPLLPLCQGASPAAWPLHMLPPPSVQKQYMTCHKEPGGSPHTHRTVKQRRESESSQRRVRGEVSGLCLLPSQTTGCGLWTDELRLLHAADTPRRPAASRHSTGRTVGAWQGRPAAAVTGGVTGAVTGAGQQQQRTGAEAGTGPGPFLPPCLLACRRWWRPPSCAVRC